jgi:transcription initiation factor TFIIIB Brf1 subunit/transcription initiation factor TFIIB
VRAARHPPHRRRVLGTGWSPRTAPRDLPPHPRSALFPRLLLDRRRHPLGRQPPEEGRREHPGRTEVDPRGPPGRRPDLHILDNLSAHKGEQIRRWAKENRVELCFTPTYASWANPIEAHFGPLRQFTVANSHHRNHTVQTRALHTYLRWRNKNARHPDLLAAQRRERARIRSEKGIRWGGRPITAAA